MFHDYELLDTGSLQKLERFGDYKLIRPCPLASWFPKNQIIWKGADAKFTREKGWESHGRVSESWKISLEGITFLLKRTDFGHIGLFPEHMLFWPWIREKIKSVSFKPRILNLFAYSGGATLLAAQSGAFVTHLDASKGMVQWAKDNAALSSLQEAPVRWIVEDVMKYVKKCLKRGEKYDGIILDPPTFGRGASKEIFKIENDLPQLLEICFSLLSDQPLFVLLTSHTPGYTPLLLQRLLDPAPCGKIEVGEMTLGSKFPLPSGSFGKWTP